MIIKPLKIDNLTSELPIIQGGMGIGVSRSNLAAAVANSGGVGVISAAQIGYDEDDFAKDPVNANIRSLKKHIKLAKERAKSGIIGLNVMVAMENYKDYVRAAVDSKIDLIISGAGLPLALPKLVKGTKVKIAPIVSSVKAIKTILKVWDRKENRIPDLVVVEGPKAGGHLGYSLDELTSETTDLKQIVIGVVDEVKKYEHKYNKKIPVVAAGGIFDGNDIADYLKAGASGVQMATRFIGTHECDASDAFKNSYLSCTKDEIELVKSPVGMPGRAILNKLVERLKTEQVKVKKCYGCLRESICDRVTIPYCITEALINAVKGNIDEGLLFCGANAYKVDKIVSVKEMMQSLKKELSNA
ncbi:NAD(P)H-dependent flavin oxidoreductase [Haloplasma contractile]|uniref:Nitronate monooxygenase protein n=1 Tax=Haloplasma contractile SSD-17B TaxID=1033810 RepID=U2FDW8_9MOLU|nr:nitronate monooxygenase family protein [Haloplasma contractile]ERJ11175.1 nitronate monooxygenase protein [Haloplasma contractile SSD-17B]